MKTVVRECKICGKKFTCPSKSRQQVCDDESCRWTLQRSNRLKAIKKAKVERELKKISSNLETDAAKAKALGITYGESKSRQYSEILWNVSKSMRKLEGVYL